MGYYKNQEIEEQIEEPDRLPVAATSHIAFRYYDSRTARLREEKRRRKERRSDLSEKIILITVVLFVGVIAVMGWVR
jgi:hypothetical protein